VRADIPDLERGHNLLLELSEPALVAALSIHAERLHAERCAALARFGTDASRSQRFGDLELHFRPRLRRDPLRELFAGLGRGLRLRLCASHLSGRRATRELLALLRRGAQLEILAEATPRRVVPETERVLIAAGASLRRIDHSEKLPMHNKFLLIESPARRVSVLGSFNWTQPSLWLNREIGLVCSDPKLFDALAERWEILAALADAGAALRPARDPQQREICP
jgi:hypothetical protein